MVVEVWLACVLLNGAGNECAVFTDYETCQGVLEVSAQNPSILGMSQCAPVKLEFPDKSAQSVGATRVSCANGVVEETIPYVR